MSDVLNTLDDGMAQLTDVNNAGVPPPPLPPAPAPPVSAPPSAKVNKYLELMEAADADSATRLRVNLRGAQRSTPDDAASAVSLARETGMPTSLVERNLSKVSGDNKVNKYLALMEESPKLADWLAADPINAKVAKNDGKRLAEIEAILRPHHLYDRKTPSTGEPAALLQLDSELNPPRSTADLLTLEGDQYIRGGLVRGFENLGQGLHSLGAEAILNRIRLWDEIDAGKSVPLLKDSASYGSMDAAQRKEAREVAESKLFLIGVANKRSQQFTKGLPQNPAVAPFIEAVDDISLSDKIFEQLGEAGKKFWVDPLGITSQMTADSLAYMIPPLVMSVFGPPGTFVGRTIPDWGNRLMDIIKDEMIAFNAKEIDPVELKYDPENPEHQLAFRREYPDISQRATMRAFLGAVVVGSGTTGLFKLARPIVPGAGVVKNASNLGVNLTLAAFEEGLSEAAARFFAFMPWSTSEVVSEMLGGAAPGAAATIKASVDEYQAKKQEAVVDAAKKTISAISAFVSELQNHIARKEALTVDDLIAKVADSDLNKLSPEKMREFLRSLSPDADEKTVFIPSEAVATYLQELPSGEAQALVERLGIGEQMARATTNNEDIAIPLSQYLTEAKDAHTAWRKDIRTEVDGFSIRQAQEWEKTETEETKAALARFEEQVQAGVVDDPKTIVYQQALAMFKANGEPNEVAAQHAALWANQYHTAAVRNPNLYTDALDAFQKTGGGGVRVQSVLPDGTRVIGPDHFDVMLDSIRSGKDPELHKLPQQDAHLRKGREAAVAGVLGEAPPAAPTPAQAAADRQAQALTAFRTNREQVAQALESMGLDPAKMTNAQIRAAVAKALAEEEGGQTLEQDDPPPTDRAQPLSDSLIMVAQRGERATGNRLLLSAEEKAAIEASVGPSGLSAKEITATVRRHKLAHPPAQGWEPLVFVRARLDDKGKPEFMYQQVPYGFIKGNDGKEIQPTDKRYAARVKAIGDAMAEEVRSVYQRALAGDKNAQNILAQAGWYKAMRARLRQEFGGLGDLFADALGATSPNTPVRGNWENAVDSLRRASRGDFDELMPKWVAWSENIDRLEIDLRAFVNEQRAKKQASKIEPWMDSDKPQTKKSIKEMPEYIEKRKALSEARELPEDLMPKKESGAKYGFNGKNVVRAMLDVWRTIKDADPDVGRGGTAPKALNFSGNLIGFRGKATIDVWAARLLQRLAGKSRIPSMAEATVSGEMLSDASTTKQFGFGQSAFDHAVDVIRGDAEMKQDNALATINADDLQAVVWFIEKEVWTVNNWTSVMGEGGSFELEANLTGTAKQDRVRELRKVIDSSPSGADTNAVAGADAVSAKVEAWDAEHKADLDELGEINQRLASEAPSKKEASDLKKRAKELQKATKLPKEIAQEMRDVANGQRRIDELAAEKVLARAELATLERPVDRYAGGLSTQMSIDNQGVNYVPTDADMARLGDAIRLAIYENDATANVLASKALPTEGRYGSVERSLDLEIVAREGYDPSTVWAEMLRQAQAARQDSTFLSRVLRDGEAIDYTRHRPGVEIYFRDAAAAQQLEKMLEDLAKEGVSFLTVSVDGRRMPGYVAGAMPAAVGVRLQYIPEFEQRYGNDDLLGLDDAAIAAKIKGKGHEMQDVAMAVAANVSGVSFSGVFWHETEVAFSHQYQEKIDGLATGVSEREPGSTRGEAGWQGQSVRAGLANADRQSREAASGKSDGQREPVVGGDEAGDDAAPGRDALKTLFQSARLPDATTGDITDTPEFKRWFGDSLVKIEGYEQEARGSITFGDSGAIIRLMLARNLSTLAHEGWHLWFKDLEFAAAQPGASDQIKADWQTVLKFVGSTDGRVGLSDYEFRQYSALKSKVDKAGVKSLDGAETDQWEALQVRIEQNEKLARAGEAYLMEGKAPSEELRGVFRSFKNWLISIYKTLKSLNAPISPEMRQVFDRMIATDEEIAAAKTTQGLNPLFATAADAEMTEAEFRAYTKRVNQVVEEAEQRVLEKAMADIRQQRTKEWKAENAKTRQEVRDELMADPGQAALHLLRRGELYVPSTAGPQQVDPKVAAQIKEVEEAIEAIRNEKNERNAPDFEALKASDIAELEAKLASLKAAPTDTGGTPAILKGAKLDRAELVEMLGEDGLSRLPAALYRADGISADLVAAAVGAGSGSQLVERLMQIEAEQAAMRAKGDNRSVANARIAEETARRMTERHGDPLNDGTIVDEAMAAVHSDKQGALMSVDLAMLARKAGRTGAVSVEQIQQWAADTIDEMSQYQATQFAKYQRAERTAGQQVQRALIKQDWVAAFKAKQDQIANFALYVEAKKAADDTGKITTYLDKVAGAKNIKALDQNYLDTIHETLEEFDFKRRSGPLLAERTLWNAYAAEQKERGVEVQEPPRLKGSQRKHYSQMTMGELRGLYDTIKQIDRLGRKKQELLIDGKKRALDAVLTEMEATAAAGVQRGSSLSTRGQTDVEKSVGKAKHVLRLVNSNLLKIERLLEFADGDKTGNGIFSRSIYRPIANAQHATNDRRVELGKKTKAIYEKVPLEQRNAWSKIHVLPEIGAKLSKEEIIVMALNMGNASNLEKMLLGEGWSDAGVRAVVNKYLTKEEWRFVQDQWDLIESQWPEAAAMIRDVEGVEPPKIEAVPLETPFGTLNGGYFPIEYARDENLKGDKVGEMKDSALLVGQALSPRYGRPSTKAGSTIARTGFNAPLNLSLTVIGKHLDEITHDIFHRRAVADVFKIISNDRFREAMRSRLGVEYEKVFMPWLNRVANEARQANVELAGVDWVLRAMRVNVTQMAMGLRVSTMVQQTAGFAASAASLGPNDLGAGLAEYLPNPAAAARKVYAMSGEMRHRANNLERDIKANLDKFRGKSSKRADLARFAFRGIALMDLAVSIPTWLGAYKQGLTKGMPEADAIAYADKMVRDTQGAGGVKDLSAFQGGGGEGWKILGMFYSFLNVFYNAQQAMLEAARKPGKTFSDYADLWWQATMWMVVAPLLAAAVSGQGPDDDEDALYWAMRTVGFGAFSGIPVVRDAMSTLSRELGGKPTAGFQMSPVAGPISGATRLVKDLINLASGEDVSTNFIKNTFNVVGGFTGLPTGQIGVTSQFLWDSLVSGAENPDNLLEWMRGLTFGPKK